MSLVPTYSDSETEADDLEAPEQTEATKNCTYIPESNFGLTGADKDSDETDEDDQPFTSHVAAVSPKEKKAAPSLPQALLNPFRPQEKGKGKVGKSVFDNDFIEAESSELQKLQKHVKLAPRHEDLKTLNGRKICWSFKKGRCKFGMKCKFAHFTDLIAGDCENKKEPPPSWVPPVSDHQAQMQLQEMEYVEEESDRIRKRRPGLSEDLVPNKKVLQMYYRTKHSK